MTKDESNALWRKAAAKKNDGLACAVIAGILLIAAFVFLFLSFRYNTLHQRVFVPLSTEFFVCILAFLFFGLFTGQTIYNLLRFREYRRLAQGIIDQ